MSNETLHPRPFCWQGWKAPVLILVLLYFATLAWTYHLVKEHNVMARTSVATTTQVATAQRVAIDIFLRDERATVVNILRPQLSSNTTTENYVAVGSGVLISPVGYLVTAQHLIQNFDEIQVRVQTAQGPKQYVAKMVKVVPEHNLALLKIVSREQFPYLTLEQGLVRIGEVVRAWGDPMGTEALQRLGTVTRVNLNKSMNILNRNFTHLLQTDAVVHWSQSGGPLINSNGRLVGINFAVEDPTLGIMGYAVPSQILLTHFQELVDFSNSGVTAKRPADRWWQRMRNFMSTNPAILSLTTMPIIDPAHETTMRIFGYPLSHFLGLVLLGFISGISGGMMTMGGGIIKITGLMWIFGYGLLLVRPVAYITNIFMYGAASLRYRQDGLLNFAHCRPLIPWAMGGMVLGYFIGNVLSTTIIQWLLGGFALLLAGKMLLEITESKRQPTLANDEDILPEFSFIQRLQRYFGTDHFSPKLLPGLLGLPMGLISGILGITGGVVEVPLQRYVARMALRNAIANSATLVFFTSLVGSVVALFHGTQNGLFEWHTPIIMALILTPGAWVGGKFGAWLTAVVPLNTLRAVYVVLMFIIALRMFIS